MDARKFNDIGIGETIQTGDFQMTLESIKRFAREFDPQPIHLDDGYATSGPFGQIIASGWQTLSLTMKLMAEAKPFGETPLIGVGVNSIEFKCPVYADTTIFAHATVTGKRLSSKPSRGYVEMDVETMNRSTQEILVRQSWVVMVPA